MRRKAIERHQQREFPGSPVVRYDRDPYGESPAEAQERWYEEEAALLDGVHGLGGQTAGGIFGGSPIATSVYDPEAMARADSRVAQLANVKLLDVLDRIERRLPPADEPRRELPSTAHRRLRGR
jgi:hypothetical protein